MKVIVTGASGQLGTDVMKHLHSAGICAVGAGHGELDITDEGAVLAFFEKEKPDAVIHCAAFTAVDKAETERERCYAVNVLGTRFVSKACERCGAGLIYISSDYVFGGEGDTPYETDGEKAPLNYYGQTKLEGEREALANCSRTFVVRTSWVFGVNGRNFVRSMLWLGSRKTEISVVDDQIGSPTFTDDLAALLCDMVQTERYGIYHATNEGFCSWADFARAIMEQANLPAEILPIPSSQYPCDAKRPHNSRLSKASLTGAGFSLLPTWQDALTRYLAEAEKEENANG